MSEETDIREFRVKRLLAERFGSDWEGILLRLLNSVYLRADRSQPLTSTERDPLVVDLEVGTCAGLV